MSSLRETFKTIGLYRSMIASGEDHSPASDAQYALAVAEMEAVKEKTIIEILEPLTEERDIDALLNTLRELFDDNRWTALGIRVRLARILTDFGLPTDPPNE